MDEKIKEITNQLLEERISVTRAFRVIRETMLIISNNQFNFLEENGFCLNFKKDGTFISGSKRLLGDFYRISAAEKVRYLPSDKRPTWIKEALQTEAEIVEDLDWRIRRVYKLLPNTEKILDNGSFLCTNNLNELNEYQNYVLKIKRNIMSLINDNTIEQLMKYRFYGGSWRFSVDGDFDFRKDQLFTVGPKRKKDSLIKAVNEILDPQIELSGKMVDLAKNHQIASQ